MFPKGKTYPNITERCSQIKKVRSSVFSKLIISSGVTPNASQISFKVAPRGVVSLFSIRWIVRTFTFADSANCSCEKAFCFLNCRSEERRVGKECRLWWWRDYLRESD